MRQQTDVSCKDLKTSYTKRQTALLFIIFNIQRILESKDIHGYKMESHNQSKLDAYLIVKGLSQEVELLPELLARHRRLLLVDHGVPQSRRPLVQPHAVPRTQILIISNIRIQFPCPGNRVVW